jgi:DNA polymerase-3 subunit beta
VLGNVLVETDGPDKLRLSATDLLLAVRGAIPATVEQAGSIALGARDLLDRIRMMPEGQVSITTTDGANTTIRAVGTARRYTLHGIPGEEFPALPHLDEAQRGLTVPVRVIADLVEGTYFSISPDETRSHLKSALFRVAMDSAFRMVTTDGHRLSKNGVQGRACRRSLDAHPRSRGSWSSSASARRPRGEAGKSDDADSLEISMVQAGPNVFFHLGGFHFSVKLVDAQFPPYSRFIPEASERVIRAPRLPMADALRAVSVAASERTGGGKSPSTRGRSGSRARSPESGEGFDEVPVEYDGPEVTVRLQTPSTSTTFLLAIDDDEILLGLSGELDPAIIRPANETPRSSYLAVVMPMRI